MLKKETNKNNHAADIDSAEFERERLTSLINSMADAVVAIDNSGQILLYNGAALNIFDTNQSLVGKGINEVREFYNKENQLIDFKNYVLNIHTQKSSRDLKLKCPDGSDINLYISVAPVRLGYGKKGPEGFVTVLRDITREKSLEEERDEFISVVSHELRTPIAIAEGEVSNAIFMAERSGESKQINDSLKQAYDQILFLGSMINDLSTLSRAERGKLNVEIEKINASELLNELHADYLPQAKEKGLKLDVHISPHLELLKSSKLYVREILQNFITNAIKYTEKGRVSISAESAKNGLKFEVSDTGIGISQTDKEKVFDKFFRSEDYRTKASSGTGLGLYVTLKLARLVKADVNLDSEINKGSTFSVYFPNLE